MKPLAKKQMSSVTKKSKPSTGGSYENIPAGKPSNSGSYQNIPAGKPNGKPTYLKKGGAMSKYKSGGQGPANKIGKMVKISKKMK